MERCYLQLWWYFFTKCEQEKKSLLYLKVKDGTFKCVTTALLHKQKSDTSQDALKMSQNISIVPVKPDVGHAKGKNWPFGRENYLKIKTLQNDLQLQKTFRISPLHTNKVFYHCSKSHWPPPLCFEYLGIKNFFWRTLWHSHKVVGQFGTGQFGTGQFGTRTIWHQDNWAPDNLAQFTELV